ncbi:hypothetical protein FHL15_000055 [Xylaria flabelliformis]|uniref:Uncharacterized protein n=1 Tax=Xylaria flabelliformis TaxID=2512241 RepID=A0A553IER8_9PEZI|nr:hypothetical protein FHL15_000055 [Xylaria flabelliformis]
MTLFTRIDYDVKRKTNRRLRMLLKFRLSLLIRKPCLRFPRSPIKLQCREVRIHGGIGGEIKNRFSGFAHSITLRLLVTRLCVTCDYL